MFENQMNTEHGTSGISLHGFNDVEDHRLRGFLNVEAKEERERLRKLSDEELIREGKTARFLCAPNQNFGKRPRKEFAVGIPNTASSPTTVRT